MTKWPPYILNWPPTFRAVLEVHPKLADGQQWLDKTRGPMGDRSYLVNGPGLLALAISETNPYPISTFHLPEKHVETVATLCYVVKKHPGLSMN